MTLLHTAHVPAGPGPFPTVILLHGWGASAHDLFGLAPYLRDGQALVLCPQGTVELEVGPGTKGYGWFPLPAAREPGKVPEADEFRKIEESFRAGSDGIRGFLDGALERYPVDPDRLAIAGFSQGGLMALEQALSAPSRFAGLAALSTWFPEPLAERIEAKPEHEEFPVLMLHGTHDPMIDVERAREGRERLRPYGVRLQYREFPMGHEIRPEALRLFADWLDKVWGLDGAG